jgi:hypothetical protein
MSVELLDARNYFNRGDGSDRDLDLFSGIRGLWLSSINVKL